MALQKERKDALMKEFAKSSGDTGSIEVQIALLTENIKELTEHCKVNHKDFSSKRGLLKMVSRRRTFLDYLRKTDEKKYKDIIGRLGLKK